MKTCNSRRKDRQCKRKELVWNTGKHYKRHMYTMGCVQKTVTFTEYVNITPTLQEEITYDVVVEYCLV